MAVTYESIATTTVASSGTTSTITFGSIATSWTDLRIVAVINAVSAAATLRFNFNNTTTATYGSITYFGDSANANSDNTPSLLTYITPTFYQTLVTNLPAVFTFDIMSYQSGVTKPVLMTGSQHATSSGVVSHSVGYWTGTSVINRVDLSLSTGTFNAGSVFTLFGIKAA